MKHRLSVDLFTQIQDDYEKRQYIILAELKNISKEFNKNRVYPYLSHLVDLRKVLYEILNQLNKLRSTFPKKLEKVDLVKKKLEYKEISVEGADMAAVEDLIGWALPLIEKTIKEGAAIHVFVENELYVETVGIIPNYKNEGYLFVPDNQKKRLNLFRFEQSVFRSSEDRYRAIKTRFLKYLDQSVFKTNHGSIKLSLIKEEKDLPNPATYAIETELDFPFDQTIFPVARRKLMRTIYA